MKRISVVLAVLALSLTGASPVMAQKNSPDFHRVQYGPTYHAVNSFGVWFWSAYSAQHAVAICQANTPAGATCWYQGYY